MLIPDEEQNKRFERWVLFIRKNYDVNSKQFLRYIWDLYDELINQIKELTKIKNNGNSKN
jgi:hypothetical protein